MIRKQGFTLLEVLVALGVFSVVLVLVTTSFKTVLDLRNRTNQKAVQLHQLQLAMLMIERDMLQIIQYGSQKSSLTSNGLDTIQFMRAGVINPLARHKRSTLQNVTYSVSGGDLVRTSKDVVEENKAAQPSAMTLLSGINRFRVQFWTHKKQWLNEWPEDKNSEASKEKPKEETPHKSFLPKAITFIFEIQGKRQITRTFLVPIGDYYAAP